MRSTVRFDETLARGYEDWYAAAGRRADALEKSHFGDLLGAFPEANTLLDAGCGTGHFTRWFASRGLRPTGLDLSPAMLAQAVRRGGGSYLRADAASLPFADGEFDLVTLVTTLEFVPEPARVLTEAVRVSRRGLILGVLNRWSFLALRRRLRGGKVWRQSHFFSTRELERLLREAAGDRLQGIRTRTALFPRGLECAARFLPLGGIIVAGVELCEVERAGEAGS